MDAASIIWLLGLAFVLLAGFGCWLDQRSPAPTACVPLIRRLLENGGSIPESDDVTQTELFKLAVKHGLLDLDGQWGHSYYVTPKGEELGRGAPG
jgi:hypothetical protein